MKTVETTMLVALILATGCSAGGPTTEPESTEQAVRAGASTDRLVGSYQGPRVRINDCPTCSEQHPLLEGTLFLRVTRNERPVGHGYCDEDETPYAFELSVRLDSGEEGRAQSTRFAKLENGRLDVFYRSGSGCEHDLRFGLDIGEDELRVREYVNLDHTEFGSVVAPGSTTYPGGLEAGSIFKKMR